MLHLEEQSTLSGAVPLLIFGDFKGWGARAGLRRGVVGGGAGLVTTAPPHRAREAGQGGTHTWHAVTPLTDILRPTLTNS